MLILIRMLDVYSRDADLEDAWYSMEAPKHWKLDSTDVHQIGDIKGLRQRPSSWKNILHASPFILDCVEYGYHLP